MTDQHKVLETKNLNIYYGNFLAVSEVNITIPRHRITAIIGPSGSWRYRLPSQPQQSSSLRPEPAQLRYPNL